MASTVEIVIKTIDQSTKETKEVSGGFKDMAKGIGIAVAAVTASVLAMKKAIDLGAEGAKFDLLGQSAKNLGVDVEALQDSVGGTISEFGIMNATATLLAGTSGNLQEALVGSSDKLLEIAKAANAVNPALGDTTFLYESLGRGIKRASPLILDNLGLVVKVGAANERMAESLGKTVAELTAEEKQMALLNEVLRTGGTLIEQAAGLSTEAADAYAKFGAQGKDAADRLKAAWGLFFAPFVSGMADGLEKTNALSSAMTALNTALQNGKLTTREYADAISDLKGGTDEERDAALELASSINDVDVEIENSIGLHSEFARHTRLSAGATQEAAEANEDLAIALDDVNSGLGSTLDKYLETIKFIKAGGIEIQKQTNKVWSDFEAGLITAGEAELLITGLTIDLAFAMDEFGDMTFEEIVQELEDMGLPLNHAVSKAQELQREMELIDGAQADLFINIHQSGSIPGGIGDDFIDMTSAPDDLKPEQVKPQFADGGFAKAGELAIVGERGPELFMPGSSGTVIPNNQSAAMLAGGGNSGVQHGEMMDMFATFAEQIAESVSSNQGAL